MTEKRCSGCKKRKSLDEFHANQAQGDGHDTYCRTCRVAYTAEWRERHPDRVREYVRRDNARPERRQAKREAELAARKPCPQCGEPMGPGSGWDSRPTKLCEACHREVEDQQRLERGRLVEQLWADGLSIAQIGKRLGFSTNYMNVEMVRLREHGFHLPYRRQPSKPKHPELAGKAKR